MYEDFSKTQFKQGIQHSIIEADEDDKPARREKGEKGGATHIFQALQYLRKLCSHPLLVMNEQHPEYSAVVKEMNGLDALHGIDCAPKLCALK